MTKILSDKKLKKKLLQGAKLLNDAVTSTLGPYGRTTLITNSEGKLVPTKDGVSVAKEFKKLEDYGEDAGAQMIKKVAIKSGNEAGDGTTTSTLLAYSMLKKGHELVEKGHNPVLIKKGMDLAVDEILATIKSNVEEIIEDDQIKEVATISGNNDEEIGNLILSAFQKVGREGVISLTTNHSPDTTLEVVEGMQFDRGYLSPYFVTDNEKMSCVLEKPYIFIYNGTISDPQDILELLNFISNTENKTVIIIADDINGAALSTLVVNKMRGIVNSVAVKSPDFGDRRKQILEDLAIVTGGKVMSKEKGHNLSKMSIGEIKECLGKCRTSTVTKEYTTLIDGNVDENDILQRVELIKSQLENAKSSFDKQKLQERIGNLSGGVALISIGGNSEVEISEKKDRVEDALFATKAAIDEGIVSGGGCALLKGALGVKFDGKNIDIDLGKQIVVESVNKPFQKILMNAGFNEETITKLMSEIQADGFWEGYDLVTNQKVNMKEQGILDPFKVVKLALKNSTSVSSQLLTTSCLIYEEVKNGNNGSDLSMFQ